jgi:hypothetical protein
MSISSVGAVCRSVPNIVEPACGYVGNAKGVAHISTGAASAEACKFFSAQGNDSTPESDCERVHAVEGLYAPHTTKAKPDDTLPPRHSAPPNAPARNMNKVDRSRATKTGHIELCSGSTANGTARQVRRASHEGQREGLEADIGQSVAALARRRLTQVRQTSADRTQLGDQLPNDTHVDDESSPGFRREEELPAC